MLDVVSFEHHPLNPGNAVPFFISAGPLKEAAQLMRFTEIRDPLLMPTIVAGGFTLNGWSGNGEPDFVYYPELGMAGNSRGLPNEGKDGILSLKEPIRILRSLGAKVVIQVTNLPHESPLDVIPDAAEIAASVEPDGVEINFSCPNGLKPDGTLHEPLCNDADASGEVGQVVRQRVGDITLGAKDSPHLSALEAPINVEQIERFAKVVSRIFDYISGINTIGNQPFPELTKTNGRGGMSGPVVAEVAKAHLGICRSVAPELAYLSCGGVDSNNANTEVVKRLELGALLVGGAQEFYRARQPHKLVADWAIATS